ncbi:MAG: hypothetical protein V3R99_07580, partial [Thermoguttaceae bacterium]
ATDEIVVRNFSHGPLNPATIDDPYDYNRDRQVNGTDRLIARTNQTNPLTMLRLITPPAADKVLEQAAEALTSAKVDWLFEFEQMTEKSQPRSSTAPRVIPPSDV